MPGLRPDQVQKIHEYIHNQQLINAIKFYREATGSSLAEAKSAIEEMAVNELVKPPDDVRDRDNPILDSRIKSLLSRNRKIDAVKIYREEYGVGLKEAKDVVDGIEASMKRSGSSMMNMPKESAISGDPFADDGSRRRTILVAVGVMVLVCGMGIFFALINF